MGARSEKEAALLAFEFEYYQQFRRQLLKHQQVRLDQVLAWESSGGKHRFDRFASKSVFAQLPIDDEKAEIVTKKVASEKVIYNNGMAAKRNELQAKLLNLLEPEQKKRLAFYLDDKDSDFYDAELAAELSKRAVVFDFEPKVGMRHLERLASFRPGDCLKAEKAASDFKDEFGSTFISNRKYLEYPEEDRWDAYYETASKLMKEKYAERLKATLTDRQQKIYEKMCFKKYLKLKGPFEIFRVGPLATRLGLTQKQKSKFASMYNGIADELDKTASKLTLEGYERIVDSYPQSARKKLENVFGDPPQLALVYDQSRFRKAQSK